jgi:hypothetical protein
MAISPPAHTRTQNTTDDWITPLWLLEQLGPFDLDPCASDFQPWVTAATMFKPSETDGLFADWHGFVWMNPPYGAPCGAWLNRLAMHDQGIALVFARTETKMFFESVWGHARSMIFVRGRITFNYPDGSAPKVGHNSGGPSVLIGYGDEATRRLRANSSLGAFVELE